MTDIAFITTCKGRLEHIRQTLPTLIAEAPHEIIVVDYGCPQNVGDWVESNYPSVKVVRVDDDPSFCAARARNFGAQYASTEWLCFIDGDVMILPGFLKWILSSVEEGKFYRAALVNGSRITDTWGTFICGRKAFAKLGGYDEAFRGWGGEDDDIYLRLRFANFTESEYPANFVRAIGHDDATRTVFYNLKQKEHHRFVNQFYIQAKLDMMKVVGQPLPLEKRLTLMKRIMDSVAEWLQNGSPQPFNFAIDFTLHAWLPKPYQMTRKYRFTYTT